MTLKAYVVGMSQGVCYGLKSVFMSFWGNDMSVYMVVANKIRHGSYTFFRS